jgi:hypothetical protein
LVVAPGRRDAEVLPADAGDLAWLVVPLCDELFDADDPPVSAEATDGIETIAAPKPKVMADAPTQLARRTWLLDAP